MSDEEQRDAEERDADGESTPPEASEAEEAAAATDSVGEESAAEAPESGEEPVAEASEAEEAAGEDAQGQPEPAPPTEPERARPTAAGETVPGADLEPIAIDDDENLSAEERARREAEAEEERARREAELAAEQVDDEFAVREPAKLEPGTRYSATGKRKNAIARVILEPGSGKITVNNRDVADYFPRALHQFLIRQPLATTGYEQTVDVSIRVNGGGVAGQASAGRHGIARALTEVDRELRGELKRRGFLTRDSRAKERRKAGLKKARKRPQFSKR